MTSDNSLTIYGVTTGFVSSDGAKVQVQILDAANAVLRQEYVTPDNAGKWTLDHTATTLADGTYTLKAFIVDSAGNVVKTATSKPLIIDNSGSTNQPNNSTDTNATASVTVLSIHDVALGSSDTGASSADFITSDGTLVIKGSTSGFTHTGATAGDQLRVDVTNSAGTVVVSQYVTPDSNGNWSIDNRANVLADDKYTISTTIVDLAGNTVKAGGTHALAVDTNKGGTDPSSNPDTAPTQDDNATNASVVISAVSADTGISTQDFITSDGTLAISGTVANFVSTGGSAGDKVRVQVISSDGSVVAEQYLTPTGNNWSFDNSAQSLSDGNYTLKAAIVDASVTQDGHTYAVYHANESTNAQLLIDQAILNAGHVS